jgi:hypothetical protein
MSSNQDKLLSLKTLVDEVNNHLDYTGTGKGRTVFSIRSDRNKVYQAQNRQYDEQMSNGYPMRPPVKDTILISSESLSLIFDILENQEKQIQELKHSN